MTGADDSAGGAVSVSAEPRISYVIARLERAIRATINERLRPHGLTTLQYTTLSVLASRGHPLSNAQLARRAYMTPQAMIEVLTALETKGLIRREPHPNHRRVYPASLTEEGDRVLASCDAVVEAMEQEMLRRARACGTRGLPRLAHDVRPGAPRRVAVRRKRLSGHQYAGTLSTIR